MPYSWRQPDTELGSWDRGGAPLPEKSHQLAYTPLVGGSTLPANSVRVSEREVTAWLTAFCTKAVSGLRADAVHDHRLAGAAACGVAAPLAPHTLMQLLDYSLTA